MGHRQGGFTAIELVVVLAIMTIVLSFMTPLIMEPIRHAKIKGAIAQAKEIVSSCNLVRVSPISTTRNPTNQRVTSTYGPVYMSWTNVTTLKSRLATGYVLPTENPFGRPYLFKMTDKACTVAVELDVAIEGWEGYDIEQSGTRTRIVVGTPARSMAGPSWVQHQKRLLTGESIR